MTDIITVKAFDIATLVMLNITVQDILIDDGLDIDTIEELRLLQPKLERIIDDIEKTTKGVNNT